MTPSELAELALANRERRMQKSAGRLEDMLQSIRKPLAGGGGQGVLSQVIRRLNAMQPEYRNALLGSLLGGTATGAAGLLSGSDSALHDALTGAVLGGVAGGGLTLGARGITAPNKPELTPEEVARVIAAATPPSRWGRAAAGAGLGTIGSAGFLARGYHGRGSAWREMAANNPAELRAALEQARAGAPDGRAMASLKRSLQRAQQTGKAPDPKAMSRLMDARLSASSLRDAAGNASVATRYPNSSWFNRLVGGVGRDVQRDVESEMAGRGFSKDMLKLMGEKAKPKILRRGLSFRKGTGWKAAIPPAAAALIAALVD